MLLNSMNTLYDNCVAKSTQFGICFARRNNLGKPGQNL